jgi:hypothetical protein
VVKISGHSPVKLSEKKPDHQKRIDHPPGGNRDPVPVSRAAASFLSIPVLSAPGCISAPPRDPVMPASPRLDRNHNSSELLRRIVGTGHSVEKTKTRTNTEHTSISMRVSLSSHRAKDEMNAYGYFHPECPNERKNILVIF